MVSPAVAATLGLMAAAVGWTVGAAVPDVRAPFSALVAGLVMVEVTVVRAALAAGDPDGGRGWMAVEALFLAVAVKLLHLVTLGSAASVEVARYPEGLVEIETVVGWVLALVVWALGHTTLHDVELLGYPGDGPGDPDPMDLLTRRFFRLGFVAVVVAAVAVVGLGGLVDVERAPAVGTFLPVLGYFAVGLVGLGGADLRHETRQWRRDEARIDGDVERRWRSTLAILALVVIVAGVAVPPRSSGVGGLAPALTGFVTTLGRSAVDWFGFEFGDADRGARTDRRPPPVIEGTSRVGDRDADRIRDVSLLLLLVGAVGLAFVRFGVRPRVAAGGRGGSVAVALGRLVRDAAVALWRALLAVLRGVGSLVTRDRPQRSVAGGEHQVDEPDGWIPPDEIRRRVVGEYRQFLDETRPVAGGRRPSETSGEYGRRVAAVLPDPGPVRRLTYLFDLARYTRRRLPPSTAVAATRALEQVRSQLGGDDPDLR